MPERTIVKIRPIEAENLWFDDELVISSTGWL